ncbi:MAG TPA: RagB/SusD family nutrient uptake outer membrane protein [Arenibacter sp.]|nr:RagB/SusD family nutrient uptake outer membrane protein [Arenibacter sp.]
MKNKITLALLLGSMLLNWNCTDLEENILDESLNPSTEGMDEAIAALAPVYAKSNDDIWRHTNYFAMQEISTDEAILPYRGGTDWGDGGKYMDLYRHAMTPGNAIMKDVWNGTTKHISRAVSAINALTPLVETNPQAVVYLAEAKAMRALFNHILLDAFGLVFVKDNIEDQSVILRGTEAVDYLISELEGALPDLATTTAVGPGRMTKTGAMALLARIHLNAPVYRDPYGTPNFGQADMDAVINYTNEVISSGEHALSAEYFEIFDDENHTNKELIFAIDQRADLGGHNRLAYFSMSGDFYPLPEFPDANGTDGPAITPDFYQTWVDAYGAIDPAGADPRFYKENLLQAPHCISAANFDVNRGIYRGLLYGLQHEKQGDPFERCEGDKYVVDLVINHRSDVGAPVFHTLEVDFIENSSHSSGYRVLKYEFSKTSDSGRNRGQADIVVLRYADIYLMRAEAKLRKGDAPGALADVNLVRASRTARHTAPALETMDLDVLYRERGFEFYWEFQRRTDMIRFGKYEDSYTEKTNSDPKKRLFPIPQSAVDGASILEGYLVQNDGY